MPTPSSSSASSSISRTSAPGVEIGFGMTSTATCTPTAAAAAAISSRLRRAAAGWLSLAGGRVDVGTPRCSTRHRKGIRVATPSAALTSATAAARRASSPEAVE